MIIKDNHMIIQSTLELINSFNDTHILKDNNTLIKISMLNLEKEVVKDVEQQILPAPEATLNQAGVFLHSCARPQPKDQYRHIDD